MPLFSKVIIYLIEDQKKIIQFPMQITWSANEKSLFSRKQETPISLQNFETEMLLIFSKYSQGIGVLPYDGINATICFHSSLFVPFPTGGGGDSV